jgi:hypothetical protein
VNRRMIVFLNVALLALAASLGWLLRTHWLAEQARQNATLSRPTPIKAVMPLPPLTPAKPVAPAEYIEVAEKMLFSKDRNPNVVLEPPPPAPPPPPMPALPSYHGQMAIGEPVILLSADKVPQKSYHAGDTIGEFKVLRFDPDKITFEWNGKTVERKPRDIMAKEAAPATTTAAPAAAAPATAARPSVAAIKPAAPQAAASAVASKDDPLFGPETRPGVRACVGGDTSPNGTLHDGYKKTSSNTMFGEICTWEKVQ